MPSLDDAGYKSPNSSEYNDDLDHPAVGFTPDNRKVSIIGFTQTRDDYEGATETRRIMHLRYRYEPQEYKNVIAK